MRLDIADDAESCRGGDGVAAEGRCAGLLVFVGDCRRRDKCTDGRTVAECLCHGHDVGLHIVVLDAEHPARARKARLHLVRDEERAEMREDLLDALEVAGRRDDDARVALDGLGDKGGGAPRCNCSDDVLDHIGTGKVTGGVFLPHGTAVAVRIRCKADASDGGRVGAPHGNARQAHRQFRAPVESAAQGDELAAARSDLGKQCRALICLRACGAEEALLQCARGDACELLGEIDEVLRKVDVADVLEGVDLLRNGGIDLGIAVPAVDDGDAREAVEIRSPLAVVEVLHGAAYDLAWVAVEMPQTGHDVLLFLFQYGSCADVGVFADRICCHEIYFLD